MTDAAELWSTCFTPNSLATLVGTGAPGQAWQPSAPHTQHQPPTGREGAVWDSPKGVGTFSWLCSRSLKIGLRPLVALGGAGLGRPEWFLGLGQSVTSPVLCRKPVLA